MRLPTMRQLVLAIALAAAAGQGANVLVLPAQGQGHCEFTVENEEQALAKLVAWVDSGSRPAP